MMFGNDFCNPKDNENCCTNSSEKTKIETVRNQEVLVTSESPLIKEQKQSIQICSELKKLEKEKLLKEKHKILLHQNENEIRQLVAQIRRARIQRQLFEQKSIKENNIKEKAQTRLEETRRFHEECKRNKEIDLQKERESVRKKSILRQDLLKQMQEKDKQRELEREIIAKEGENRKKLLFNIQREIEEEKQEVLELKERLRHDKDEYLQKVELYKKQQQLEDQEDLEKERELRRQREEAKTLRMEKRKRAMQERAATSERIGQQIYTLQMEKEKHNNLLLELLIGERLAKDDARYNNNLQEQIQRARALREDFQRTFLGRQRETHLRREQEKNATKEQLKLFLDLEQKDKDKKDLKLSNNKQYRQDLLNAIEYRIREREFEVAQDKSAHEKLLELQMKRTQEIEAEKLRLLREEPVENLKFLPIKTISDEHRLILKRTCNETNGKV